MRSRYLIALALCLALLCHGASPGVVQAAPGDLIRTLAKPNPQTGDLFGYALASQGEGVLATVPCYGAGGNQNASAVYSFNGNTGALTGTFLTPGTAFFGYSVCYLGSDVLVGAVYDSNGGSMAGAAYLYEGATGNFKRMLQKPVPAAYDNFGVAVVNLGGKALVGAHGDDTGAGNAGAAYLFNPDTGGLVRTFQNPTPTANQFLASALAPMGSNVLVGAPAEVGGVGIPDGAAYLFDGTSGALLKSLVNPTPSPYDHFGHSVAALGNNILVSAPGHDAAAADVGAVYLYDGDSGLLIRTLQKPVPQAGDGFGTSIAIVGGNVLVGAPGDDSAGPDAGAAYLFDGANGQLLAMFLNPSPDAGDAFGFCLAAVGNDVVISAPWDDANGANAGAVYVFEGVPEPATLSLLAVGGLMALRRRR